MKFKSFLLAMIISLSAPGLWAQMRGHGMLPQDPMARLDHVLQSAGADPLSDAQRQQLTDLLNAYKTAHQNAGPDASVQSAKKDLEAAVLSGNEGAIDTASAAIAAALSRRASRMIADMARFEIQVLKILTAAQVSALKTQYGNQGLVHTLGSLVWAGGMGRGMGHGMGPGMPPGAGR